MKRLLVAPAVLAVFALAPGALAASTSHSFTETVYGGVFPSATAGGAPLQIAQVTSALTGPGAAVSALGGSLTSITQTGTEYFATGSLKFSAQYTPGMTTGARTSFTGTGKFTSGGGKYKGARGSFTITGYETTANGEAVITAALKGTLKY